MRNPFASTLWRNQAFVRVWSAASILIGAAFLWTSPMRHLLVLPPAAEGEPWVDPLAIAAAAEMERPPGA